jgi:hypothetical protein
MNDDEPLRILPKSIELPSDDRPCVRPLTEKEALAICKKHGVSPAVFLKHDFESLAANLPSKTLAKICLIRDASSMESVDLATKVLSKIVEDSDVDAKIRIQGARELGKLQKIRAVMFENIMKEAEKAEDNLKKERSRGFSPSSFNVQVNLGPNGPTQNLPAIKTDSPTDIAVNNT